jgi:hypothetical protein
MFFRNYILGKLILSSTIHNYEYLYNAPDRKYTFTVHASSESLATCEYNGRGLSLIEPYHAIRQHSEERIKVYYFGGEFI